MITDQRYGPQTAEVERLIKRARRLTPEEATALDEAWSGASHSSWSRAYKTATRNHRDGPWYDARAAISDRGWEPARAALYDAARALVVRDLINPDDFETLVAPVASVLGRCWEEKRDVRAV